MLNLVVVYCKCFRKKVHYGRHSISSTSSSFSFECRDQVREREREKAMALVSGSWHEQRNVCLLCGCYLDKTCASFTPSKKMKLYVMTDIFTEIMKIFGIFFSFVLNTTLTFIRFFKKNCVCQVIQKGLSNMYIGRHSDMQSKKKQSQVKKNNKFWAIWRQTHTHRGRETHRECVSTVFGLKLWWSICGGVIGAPKEKEAKNSLLLLVVFVIPPNNIVHVYEWPCFSLLFSFSLCVFFLSYFISTPKMRSN